LERGLDVQTPLEVLDYYKKTKRFEVINPYGVVPLSENWQLVGIAWFGANEEKVVFSEMNRSISGQIRKSCYKILSAHIVPKTKFPRGKRVAFGSLGLYNFARNMDNLRLVTGHHNHQPGWYSVDSLKYVNTGAIGSGAVVVLDKDGKIEVKGPFVTQGNIENLRDLASTLDFLISGTDFWTKEWKENIK